MSGLNRVMVLGNVCADPELRMTSGGTAVLKLRVAASERYKDRNEQWQERTEFVSCVLFGKRAESLSRILAKGSQVYVEGSLRTTSYDDRDGNKRYKTEVAVSNVILCGGKGQRQERSDDSGAPSGGGSGPDDDDIPFTCHDKLGLLT